jgi:hypothetical protein
VESSTNTDPESSSENSSIGLVRWLMHPIRVADAALAILLAGVAFILACYPLFDGDIWWHLASGQWILQHGPPQRDPFTFASADRQWIDLHWLFQVVSYLAFEAGGVTGVIFLAATAAAISVLVGSWCKAPGASFVVVLLGWVPALALTSFRFSPRPEIFSLVLLAIYLAVLGRLDDRPRLAWALPILQVAWVNTHALFVLGPVLVGFRLVDRLARTGWRRIRQLSLMPEERRWWLHVGGAAVLVVAACLVNPYGLRGALFPLELFPKVTEAGNVYKQQVLEFFTPSQMLAAIPPEKEPLRDWFIRAFHFLLLLVPLSLLLPPLWQALQVESGETTKPDGEVKDYPNRPSRREEAIWLAGVAFLVALLAVRTLTLQAAGWPAWLAWLGRKLPLAMGAITAAAAMTCLVRRRLAAAALAVLGGVAFVAWAWWLDEYFLVSNTTPIAKLQLLGALGVAACGAALAVPLIVRHGGSLFSLLAAGAFAYLALNANYNMGRMGLVAGFILGWHFAPWLTGLFARWAGNWKATPWFSAASRVALAGLLVAWGTTFVSGSYSSLDDRKFGLGERPFMFAHDAARFAGQAGMPERALVYGMTQASVFIFENSPDHKPYMDSRLELASPETFRTYQAIERSLMRQDPAWDTTVRGMRNPSLMLSNERKYAPAQAAVLSHPGWRLVYFDALAAVFLPRGEREMEARFPTLDLASRHFGHARTPPIPDEPLAAFNEAVALFNMTLYVPDSPQATWQQRIPVLLAALGRAALAIEEDPGRPDNWALLGHCHWRLLPTLRPPPSSVADWGTTTSLPWAQAAYCFRRALEIAPDDFRALDGLYSLFAQQGMSDAQWIVGERLGRLGQLTSERVAEMRQLSRSLGPTSESLIAATSPAALVRLLEARRPEAAARFVEQAGADVSWPWPVADRAAGACLQLGRPKLARRLWEQAARPPSEAARLARVGATYLVERDFAAAVRTYQPARRLDPQSTDVLIPLAWLHAETGDGRAASSTCREVLTLRVTEVQQAELQGLQRLLEKSVPPGVPAEDQSK